MPLPRPFPIAPPCWVVCLAALASAPAQAGTLHVPAEYPTIKDGIAAAVSGDIVEVSCGIYFEDTIVMKSGVTLRSDSGGPSCVTIDGSGLKRIILCSGVDASTRFEGLTFRNGYTSGHGPYYRGGAMLCNDGSAPQIVDCVFEANIAEFSYGGALACVEASPTVLNCTFRSNRAMGHEEEPGFFSIGGAVACIGSTARFEGCLFQDNDGHTDGGAVYADQSPLTIQSCEFIGNIAGRDGGGIVCRSCAPVINDCVFTENSCGRDGGAIDCWPVSSPIVVGCVLTGNRAGNGGGMYCRNYSSPMVTDTWFEGNQTMNGLGGGVAVRQLSVPRFERCVFYDNSAVSGGGALNFRDRGDAILVNCTLVANHTDEFGSAFEAWDASPTIDRCIIAFHDTSPVIRCLSVSGVPVNPQFHCTNIFGNEGGDWVEWCLVEQAETNGNFSADPLFCGIGEGNFTLDGMSPCLPGRHPRGDDCGLIGARDRGCGVTAATPVTWGTVKSRFEER